MFFGEGSKYLCKPIYVGAVSPLPIPKEESEIKKTYVEIPDEALKILTDESISLIDRIKYAEDNKSEGWYSYNGMLELFGIPNTTYSRYLQVIRANNKRLYSRVASGNMSVTTACDSIRMPDYPFRARLENIYADILYIASRQAIYIYQDQCYLAIVTKKQDRSDSMKAQYSERLYLIDRKPYAIDTIIHLLEEGYVILHDLRFSSNRHRKTSTYTLRHYLYAAYHEVDVESVSNDGVWFIKPPKVNGVTDLRISNLKGPFDAKIPAISGHTAVVKQGNDIIITRKVDGLVTYTDYSPELYHVLQNYGSLHTQARDSRLSLRIDDKHDVYLYHLRMVEHLYGLPLEKEKLIANIDRFRAEYINCGLIVDHLDNDCTNDSLSNLMLMSDADNNAKNSIKKAVEKLGYPFFLWADRYDNTAIKMQAGYFSQFKRPCFMVEGVFTVREFLEEAQKFVDSAREECTVFEEFRKLEEKNKKEESQS